MSNYTVLLIDYEPKSIDRIRRPLIGIGYRVEVATDGISGIEAFHRIKPDLVMVEAMIPKKHGFEVCQDLKKTPQGKRTPVIITTSVYKGRKYRNQAFHLHGCDEYIEKPIAEDQVVAICRRMLGDDGAAPAARVEQPSGAEMHAGESAAAFTPTPEHLGPLPEFPPVPPAPAGLDDDELEIMAKLDSILPGGSSRSAPAQTAPQTEARAAAAPDRDPFATSFLPSTDTTTNQDLAPRPLESEEAVATALEPMPLVPIGEAPQVGEPPAAPEEDAPAPAAFESRRSKKKDRRGKKSGQAPSISSTSLPVIPQPDADVPRMTQGSEMPGMQAEAGSTSAQPSALEASEARPVEVRSFTPDFEEETGRPWWLSVAVAVVLIGVAGALIFLFLGR